MRPARPKPNWRTSVSITCHDARSGRPHRAQALPPGQNRRRRVRRARAGGHSGGHGAARPGPTTSCFPRHRDMAVFLIRGVSPGRILAQYMGRVGGLTRGRDGNMHMGDMKHGIVSIISALAATVPVAAGHRHGAALPGQERRGLQLFRRRRHQPRRLARRRQPRHRAEAARGLHLQQQSVRLLHAAEPADGLRQRGRPRPGLQHAGRNRGRQRRAGGPRGHPARARPRARRQGPVSAGVQDLPHDRPLRARCRPLRPQGPVRRVGQARPHRPPGSAHARRRLGRPGGARRAARRIVRRKWTRPWHGPSTAPIPTPPRCSTTCTRAP